jgi:Tfp pilus assembly protein PilF
VAGSACSKGSETATPSGRGNRGALAAPPRKILFVGVDGADWDIITPLVDQGRLPHFAEFMRQGATGPLLSVEPMLSPLLWTTIATGKLPEEHGILSFTAYDPKTGLKVPVSRTDRRVDAFWNILSDHDRTVDIVGWLATYPAESIRGVMVTDRVGYLAYAGAGDPNSMAPGNVSPEARAAEVAAQVVPASATAYGDFAKIVHVDESTFTQARARSFDPKDPVNDMIMLYASTRSYFNIARHLLRRDQPDFLGVYFELVDAAGHLFMHYAPPRPSNVDPALYERYKDAVTEAYVLQDKILGELMDLVGDDTVVILASDHGFRSGPLRPQGSPEIWAGKAADWHRLQGVLGLCGPGIRKGYRIPNATILDVAPTLLALQGLPKAADMWGRVLVDAFEAPLAGQIDTTQVPTLGRQRDTAAAPTDDATAQEALKKLEALGYITRDSPDTHNNLGQRYQKQGQYEKAIMEFEKALALRPDFPAVLNNLGTCYTEIKQYERAEASLRKALALEADNVYALNNLAVMYLDLGDPEQARQNAERALEIEPNYANGHLTLGSAYGSLHELEKAEVEFRKVLEIDPANERARSNLEVLRQAAAP